MKPTANSGTWQFWLIFAEIAGLAAPTRAAFPALHGRVRQKLNILRALRDRGIWLVDASTTALYRTGVKGKPKDYEQVIRASWADEVRTDLHDWLRGSGCPRGAAGSGRCHGDHPAAGPDAGTTPGWASPARRGVTANRVTAVGVGEVMATALFGRLIMALGRDASWFASNEEKLWPFGLQAED